MTIRLLSVGVAHTIGYAPLLRALTDAEEIHRYFDRDAFPAGEISTKCLSDPSRAELAGGLEWLASTERDLAIFYYSGHTVRAASQRTALLCSDSGDEPSSQFTGMDIGRILGQAEGCSLLSILDCCFAEDVARDIRSEISWDVEGLAFLLSAESGMLTVQPDLLASYSKEAPTEKLSLFTRSLLLGLRGVAQDMARDQIDLLRLVQLANYEAVRLGGARPTLVMQGIGGKRGIRGPVTSRVLWDEAPRNSRLCAHSRVEHKLEERGLICLDGSHGLFSEMYARELLGSRNVSWLSGVGRVPFALTMGPATGLTTAVVDTVLNADVLSEARNLRVPVVATLDSRIWASPTDLSLLVIELPRLSMELISQFGSVGAPTNRTLEALQVIQKFAGDSLEVALVALESMESAGAIGVKSEELDSVVDAYLAEKAMNRTWLEIARLVVATPSVYLPQSVVVEFISSALAIDQGVVLEVLADMRRTGVIVPKRRGIRTTERVRVALSRNGIEPSGEHYRGMLACGLAHADGADRIGILSALCASVEAGIGSNSLDSRLVDLLTTAGRDLAYWAGPRPARCLLDSVLSIHDFRDRSALWLQLGDAHRLDDNYQASSMAFKMALDTASGVLERVEAQTGIASANKNLEGGAEGLQRAISEMRKVVPKEIGVTRAAARSLFQQANLSFASSDWTRSVELYEQAESLLSIDSRGDTGSLLDVWKGLGDIALHRGEIDQANIYLTKCLDLAGTRSVPLVDTRAHAKMAQFAGDVARHQSCTIEGDILQRWVDCARWWYQRAIELYSAQDLELGVLLSKFKMAQCGVLAKEYDDSLSEFMHLQDEFTRLHNALWQYKCDIMIVMCDSLADMRRSLWTDIARERVESSILKGERSKYQTAWGRLATVDGDIQEIAVDFELVGARRVADYVRRRGLAKWVGGEY